MLRWADWLGQAKAELSAAEWLLEGDRHAWCCFTCQQSAEKALKALLDRHGIVRPGHDMLALLSQLAITDQAISAAARRLNCYEVATRYPDIHPSGVPAEQYHREDAQSALEDARAILDFAHQRLS